MAAPNCRTFASANFETPDVARAIRWARALSSIKNVRGGGGGERRHVKSDAKMRHGMQYHNRLAFNRIGEAHAKTTAVADVVPFSRGFNEAVMPVETNVGPTDVDDDAARVEVKLDVMIGVTGV
jgi:hypothetical protein